MAGETSVYGPRRGSQDVRSGAFMERATTARDRDEEREKKREGRGEEDRESRKRRQWRGGEKEGERGNRWRNMWQRGVIAEGIEMVQ